MPTRTPYYDNPVRSEMQHDVLTQVLDDSYFPTHALPTLNKRLSTTGKTIVRAINEVLSRTNTVETTCVNMINQMLTVFGGFLDTPELKTNLEKVAPSVLEAVYLLQQNMVGDPDDPVTLTEPVNVVITNIQKQVIPLTSLLFSANQTVYNVSFPETDVYLVDEDNIKWTKGTDFTLADQVLTLQFALPYEMEFKVFVTV